LTIYKLNEIAQGNEPVVIMDIDGLKVRVLPHWIKMKIPINEVVEAALYHDSIDKTEKYLRNKYSPMNGVPFEYIQEETGLEMIQIRNWLAEEGFIEPNQRLAQAIPFIPFEVAASMSISALE